MSPNSDSTVLTYQSAPVISKPVVVRWEDDLLILTIAPARAAKLIVLKILVIVPLLLLSVLFGVGAITEVVEGASAGEIAWAAVPAAAVVIAMTLVFRQLITTARLGRLPASIQASPEAITFHVPALGEHDHRQWPAALIADMNLRHAGLFLSLTRCIRIRLSLSDESEAVILIPSPGGESLGMIEDNLRDALKLPAVT